MKVHTSIKGMSSGLKGIGNLERRIRRSRVAGDRFVAQIAVKVLSLQTPVFMDADFNTAAGDPSCLGLARGRRILDRPLWPEVRVSRIVHVTVCQTARAIDKHFAGGCETRASAHRSEPLCVLMGPEIAVPRSAVVLSDSNCDSGAGHARPRERGLNSGDKPPHLPVVATLSPANEAAWIR